jgi:predicted nuclease of predicted toxin-antitoxin system
VKLLFDENLSHHLVESLSDCYPESTHVRNVGLERADDTEVWAYAAASGLTIVSKDSDFHQRSLLYGPPPKVVWIHVGNCPSSRIEEILRHHQADIAMLERDPAAAFLIID